MAINAEYVFSEIQKGLKADPSICSKVNGTFLFKIGDKVWFLDLKNAPGAVKQGDSKAEVTITLSEQDFVNLMLGKETGQKLFMGGKLKIQGNMGLAMKLDKIPKVQADSKPATTTPSTTSDASGAAAKVFDELSKRIAANPSLIQQVGAVYQFNINSGGKQQVWTVDIKNGKGSVSQGAAAKADCTLTCSEDDFVGMMTGKSNSQQLFMQGKLKIGGNMGAAMKLNKLQAAKAAL